mmetsp:Transcript_11354/g.47491  ORF Transcript_11354/g.47491 Transcript_11354/m.47491 type:complete len:422 (-) Transcript_11354:1317-2582(-)
MLRGRRRRLGSLRRRIPRHGRDDPRPKLLQRVPLPALHPPHHLRQQKPRIASPPLRERGSGRHPASLQRSHELDNPSLRPPLGSRADAGLGREPVAEVSHRRRHRARQQRRRERPARARGIRAQRVRPQRELPPVLPKVRLVKRNHGILRGDVPRRGILERARQVRQRGGVVDEPRRLHRGGSREVRTLRRLQQVYVHDVIRGGSVQRRRRVEEDGEVEHGGTIARGLRATAAAVAAVLVLVSGGVEPRGLVGFGAPRHPIGPAAEESPSKRGLAGRTRFERDGRGIPWVFIRRVAARSAVVNRGGGFRDRRDGVPREEAVLVRGGAGDGRRGRRQYPQQLPPQVGHLAHGPAVQPVLVAERLLLPVMADFIVRHERLRGGQGVGVVMVKLVRQFSPSLPLLLRHVRRQRPLALFAQERRL